MPPKHAGAGFQKASSTRKRAKPDDYENDEVIGAREPKKARQAKGKADGDHEVLVPKLEHDERGDEYVALKANGTRRVTISEFKGKTLVNIREYYIDDKGGMKPGNKGIALSMEQYNALLAAAPLIESVLREKGEEAVRPDYEKGVVASVKEEEKEEEEVEEAEAEATG